MYSAVESAANAEAAEQLYQKGLQSGEAGNLAMAVRMVEKAARLMPENEAYAAKLSALSRQLKAVYAEQERDQRERGAEGAGDGWSSQRADSERTGRAGPEQDADGFFEERENADESPDRGDGERRSDFLGHKSLAEMWRSVRRTAASLLRARWAMGLGEWSVSFLPRDEERAHRLSYLGHFWLRRLELPLYLGGAALVLRLCFAYPWALFSLGCAACVPLGWLLGRALHVKRAVLAVPLCAHVLFAWQCPYSAASLYCAVGWLAFAAFFRLFALGLTGAVLWLYFLPWTTLYLLLFAVWALATVYEPVALSAVTVAGLGLWSCPVHFTSLGALAFAAVLGWDRSPLALAACAASALIYLRPKVAGRLFAAAALAWGVRRRASLCAWAAGLVGVGEDGGPEPTRPRDGDAAVSHVLRASTHYEVLAVAPAASLGQVRSAYKRMALLLHPDKNQHADAKAAFERLTEANATVTSARLRAHYDYSLRFPHSDDDEEEEEPSSNRRHPHQRQARDRPKDRGSSDEHAEALARGGIATIWEALQASVENIAARVPAVPIAVHAEAQRRLIDLCAPVAMSADALWKERKGRACTVRTGTALDDIMGGGMLTGEVLELAGRSGSGKTWLCLSACAHAALEMGASVLYVDVGSNFSAQVLLDECTRVARALDLAHDRIPTAMQRVRVVRAYDAEELVSALEHAHALCTAARTAAAADAWHAKLGLVVVDSVALALMPLTASRDSAGQLWIVSVSRALRQLARSDVGVLVTNQLVGAELPLAEGVLEDHARLALGGSWRGVSDVRVYLEESQLRSSAHLPADSAVVPKPAAGAPSQLVAFCERSQRAPGGNWVALHRGAAR